MTDPNAIYKTGFAELVLKLGRLPTANEILPLNIAYAKSWGPAEETLSAPVSAAGPGDMGFSRQPAPQARLIDARVGGGESARLGGMYAKRPATPEPEPLSGPGAPVIIPKPVSEPERPPAPESNLQGLAEGDRGPGGGLVSKCVTCGRLWERPATRGRPAYRCVTCRG